MNLLRLSPMLLRGRFARRLTLLSGGTFFGQAILMVSSPLLTRLFTPAEFGALAVFTALTSMLIVVMALRYEFAVPVCRDAEDALAVVAVSGIVVTLLSLLVALGVLVGGKPFADQVGLEGFEGLIWLLPPLLWLWGLSLPLSGWSIRQGSFRLNAASNLGQFAAQAMAQLGLGAAGGGAGSLVIGYTLGPVTRLALLWRALNAGDWARLRNLPPARLWAVAREHWRYPVFSSSSSLLQSASQMLPAVLVAALYGPAAAGLFGLTQRIMGAPVRMLSEAASQVFLSEIARAEGAAVYRLFKRTASVFLAAGLVGATPLVLAGPGLFAFAFGEPWREGGTLVQLLVPIYLARFVVVPVSQTLNVMGRQHLHLAASLLNMAALGASFGLGAVLHLPMNATVLLYSMGSTSAFLFYFGAVWHSARLAARASVPPAS
jgi:O-antigen/teichoic acid export membrane protein